LGSGQQRLGQLGIVAAVCAVVLSLATPAAATGASSSVTTVPVGAGPVAVATNPFTDTVYVGNINDNTVSVIKGRTNTVTTTIPVGNRPGSVAVNPLTNTIYVTNDDFNTVTLINGVTNTVTTTIPGFARP